MIIAYRYFRKKPLARVAFFKYNSLHVKREQLSSFPSDKNNEKKIISSCLLFRSMLYQL